MACLGSPLAAVADGTLAKFQISRSVSSGDQDSLGRTKAFASRLRHGPAAAPSITHRRQPEESGRLGDGLATGVTLQVGSAPRQPMLATPPEDMEGLLVAENQA